MVVVLIFPGLRARGRVVLKDDGRIRSDFEAKMTVSGKQRDAFGTVDITAFGGVLGLQLLYTAANEVAGFYIVRRIIYIG